MNDCLTAPRIAALPPRRRIPRRMGLVAIMAGAGVSHFVAPRVYELIVPRALDDPGFWVRFTGVAQLLGAGLLAAPRTRRLGAVWVAVLLVALFPANVQMALDGGLAGERWPLSSPVVVWMRLPLQIPLVVWALAEARRA